MVAPWANTVPPWAQGLQGPYSGTPMPQPAPGTPVPEWGRAPSPTLWQQATAPQPYTQAWQPGAVGMEWAKAGDGSGLSDNGTYQPPTGSGSMPPVRNTGPAVPTTTGLNNWDNATAPPGAKDPPMTETSGTGTGSWKATRGQGGVGNFDFTSPNGTVRWTVNDRSQTPNDVLNKLGLGQLAASFNVAGMTAPKGDFSGHKGIYSKFDQFMYKLSGLLAQGGDINAAAATALAQLQAENGGTLQGTGFNASTGTAPPGTPGTKPVPEPIGQGGDTGTQRAPGTTPPPPTTPPATGTTGSGGTLRGIGQFQTNDLATALQAAANDPDRAAQLVRMMQGQNGPVRGRMGGFRDNLYGKSLQAALGFGGVDGMGNIEQIANDFFTRGVQGNNLIGYGGEIGRKAAGTNFADMDSATMEKILRSGLALQGIGMGSLGGAVQSGRLDDIVYEDWGRALRDSGSDMKNFSDLLQGSAFQRAMQAYGR